MAIGFVGVLYLVIGGLSDWEIRQLLYWSKCTYGLFSLPCKSK